MVAADSGQALDVARVSVQQVETVIPATKNIIRRKKYKNLASVGSTQVKIPFFTNAFPLQSRRNKGGSISPPSDFVSNRRPEFKDLLFLLAPPPDFLIFLRPCLSLLFLKASLHVHQGRRNNYIQLCSIAP